MREHILIIALLLLTQSCLLKRHHEIRIGNSVAYSGHSNAIASVGNAAKAYFEMVNAQGGVHGIPVSIISLDDALDTSNPDTSLLQNNVKKLVEQEQVLALAFLPATNRTDAIAAYVDQVKVPNILAFVEDPKYYEGRANLKWNVTFSTNVENEGEALGRYVASSENRNIALLNEESTRGIGYAKGFRIGLGAASTNIVYTSSFPASTNAINDSITKLIQEKARVVLLATSSTSLLVTCLKVLSNNSLFPEILVPLELPMPAQPEELAVLQKFRVTRVSYFKNPLASEFSQDQDVIDYLAWLKKYYPSGDVKDIYIMRTYMASHVLNTILNQAADNLTRENILKQTLNLKEVAVPLLLPGITVNTSQKNYTPIKQFYIASLQQGAWKLGKLIDLR